MDNVGHHDGASEDDGPLTAVNQRLRDYLGANT
jgi:hypothetical protein